MTPETSAKMNTQSDKKVLASPNNMLWQFYASLNRQINSANQTEGDAESKQNVAVCIILGSHLSRSILEYILPSRGERKRILSVQSTDYG